MKEAEQGESVVGLDRGVSCFGVVGGGGTLLTTTTNEGVSVSVFLIAQPRRNNFLSRANKGIAMR